MNSDSFEVSRKVLSVFEVGGRNACGGAGGCGAGGTGGGATGPGGGGGATRGGTGGEYMAEAQSDWLTELVVTPTSLRRLQST